MRGRYVGWLSGWTHPGRAVGVEDRFAPVEISYLRFARELNSVAVLRREKIGNLIPGMHLHLYGSHVAWEGSGCVQG